MINWNLLNDNKQICVIIKCRNCGKTTELIHDVNDWTATTMYDHLQNGVIAYCMNCNLYACGFDFIGVKIN